jgi:hypothetical protein
MRNVDPVVFKSLQKSKQMIQALADPTFHLLQFFFLIS